MLLEKFKQSIFETHGAFYVLERFDSVNCIVDKKFLELFLCKMYFQAIIDCNFSNYKGFHLGNDGNMYERRVLNNAGLYHYYKWKIWQHSHKIMQAVKEMDKNENTEHLKEEKAKIKGLLNFCGFKAVYIYKGNERKTTQSKEQETLQTQSEE